MRKTAAEDSVRLQGRTAGWRDCLIVQPHRQVREYVDLYSAEVDWVCLDCRGLVRDHLECF